MNAHDGHFSKHATHQPTILVVEDTPTVSQLYKHFLRNAGYRVLLEPDGYAAQVLVQSGVEIDLVLTDYHMPGMSGAEFVEWLLDFGLQVPIVLVSGSEEDIERLANILPSVICRMKPFTAAEMIDLVRGVLTGHV